HEPDRLDETMPYPVMDKGMHTLRYVILPHAGNWRDARVARRAWELNEPPTVHVESGHAGELAREVGFINVGPEGVIGAAVKCAEEGGVMVVRLYEAHGKECVAEIALPYAGRSYRVAIAAHEIKTVKIDPGSGWSIEETDLLETSKPQ
ncbi:MAG TPA: alpha-mannosidase, partial [Planctomycetes bacterium]|nr:alpha-mannosidase [Planctomycetota bacterium]